MMSMVPLEKMAGTALILRLAGSARTEAAEAM
eukprot:CAMPEP_0204081586 /NCGR_PEP_ID=MMETSP0360-20130528/175757_1 /ASSEMBLY_ACC=CAM_ASM_000342 /TAXON_ID=268821 /ORGANISM="Scrippsiella Hangoei, Strain SHTV-5" /LENGTH=31 /DNA_ID= /DNA_START= /DNA_END= /DNA_ORIENTATION=